MVKHKNKATQGVLVALVASCLMMVVPLGEASAEINRLDTTFNTVGYVTHNGAAGGNGLDRGNSIAVQSDGKYVVAGYSANLAGNSDMAIWRYNSDGTLDTTFNTVGYVTHHGAAGGSNSDTGQSIAVQSDGKYVVAGDSTNLAGNPDMAIWRYNSDGTLDTTFNTVGYATHHGAAGGNGWDSGSSIAMQSDGKYVVAGYSTNLAGNADMVIWRYNSDGTLDTTFNTVGYAIHHGAAGGNSADTGQSIVVQSDGKYVVAGSSINIDVSPDMAIWRYNSDGTLDTTFNSVGYVTHNSAAGGEMSDTGQSIAVQRDGKYVVAGYSQNLAGNRDVTVWRYNIDGTLDTTFNGQGWYTNGFSTSGDLDDRIEGYSAIYIDQAGKIYCAGQMKVTYTNTDYAIIRLNPDGTLDSTLNGTGYYALPLSTGADVAYSIAYAGSGKFVLAGYMTVANSDMGIMRYEVLYQIGLPAGLTPKAGGIDISLGSTNGIYEDNVTTVLYSGDTFLSEVTADIYKDLDWSLVTGATDTVNYKSYIQNLYGAEGVDGTVALYVPYRSGDNSVGICPGATSLAEVSEKCAGYTLKRETDSDVEIVTVGDGRYWKVSGLTGTGGLSLYQETLQETGVNIFIPTIFIGIPMLISPIATAFRRKTQKN